MAAYAFSRKPRLVPSVATPNRLIQTAIPAPGTREILERLETCESRSMHGQLPLVWDRAEDFSVSMLLAIAGLTSPPPSSLPTLVIPIYVSQPP